jgi:peptidoglycan/xylan/chitin deacetylase (PgdA/CDA1 family)
MKTLVLHDIKKEFFNIDLENYQLTFDDGLFSQYYYWPLLKKIKAKKIFFIATNLIDLNNNYKRKKWKGSFKQFPTCFKSLADFRSTKNRKNYMRIGELKELIKDGVIIGAHGHNHLKEYKNAIHLKKDIEKMLEWFEQNLNIRPIHFAYPHYKDYSILFYLLRYYGFEKFYGRKRIEIEKLIE